ncbi:PAS domain S-box protein [Methanoregula sp.]|uniref:PAS domain S-box protein n=1 Tax=Methanoregula sp. TaxID=2052170 RepID=UPI003C7198F6
MSTLSTDTQPISLLCVDDDPWVLDALKIFFERDPDFSLFTCSSGSEALSLIGQYQFDAIIADYTMPDINGITLLKEIRSQNDPALFVMFTGRHLAQVAIETLNNGGNYYVQKGVEILQELPKVRDFIRNSVQVRRRDRSRTVPVADQDTRYRSLVEQQQDLLCCFSPDGTCTLANEAFNRFTGSATPGNFLAIIPEEEQDEIRKLVKSLTPENAGTYIEHNVLDQQGKRHLYQWGYRGFFDEAGNVTEYLAQGRDLSYVVRLNDILPKGSVSTECGSVQDAVNTADATGVMKPAELCNLGDSVEMIQYPIFAIDLDGKVIAWNHAIAELTGVDARTMIGQGNYAYAFPIYSEARPMLIDYILDPAHVDTSRLPKINREGDSFSGDVEEVTIRGKTVKIGSKGTMIHDAAGKTIAAIQSLLVSGQFLEDGTGEEEDTEHYIGGISSIILKVAGEGFSGAIAGAIGSATGGYGVYATDHRLFVVHNPNLDASRSEEMQFSDFLMNELFGTSVDMRPRSIAELDKNKVFEVWRKDIAAIEMKTPRFFSGFLIIRTKTGGSFRIYVDHRKAFVHLEQLLKLFYPDIIRGETTEIDSADMEWLDEVRTFELVGKLQLDDPLQGISRNINTSLPKLPPLPAAPSLFPSVTTSAGKWNDLSASIKVVPYPIFAVDITGKVIAWNNAISTLTGITAPDMIGKGDYEYAIPFYGTRKPMLIDYIIMPPDTPIAGDVPAITREGDTYIGSLESVTIHGKSMLLWGKGTGIYDPKGAIIGSIQSILVSEQPSMKAIMGIYEEETYIGGISSITVKVPGEGVAGAIAGAIGSSTGGYGVYATDQRLFIIHNPKLNAEHPDGVQFGAFIRDELFGTTVDTRSRSIQELEKEKVIEIWRKDIVTIEMKKPLLFAGYISFKTRSGESFRVYIDHKMAFIHLDQLLRLFFPEILRIE